MSEIDRRYPAYRYHAKYPPIVVNSEAEEVALGPGWVDNPAKVGDPVDTTPVVEEPPGLEVAGVPDPKPRPKTRSK